MGVDADLGLLVEDVAVGADPVPDVGHGQPPTRVGDIDAVSARVLHELGLGGELSGWCHVGEHEEPGDVHAEFAGAPNVLVGDIGLGAVRGDAYRGDTERVGALDVGEGADSR